MLFASTKLVRTCVALTVKIAIHGQIACAKTANFVCSPKIACPVAVMVSSAGPAMIAQLT